MRQTALALAVAALAATRAELGAQSSAFSASLVVPGLPSPFVSEWERNPQIATLVVTYTGTAGTAFTLAAEVKGAARGVISRATSGPYRIGAGPAVQHIASTQLNCFAAENLQGFVDQILRSGIIPEDRYELTVLVLSTSGAELARASESFTIAFPDPPRLIYPLNGASLVSGQPTFQWTPVAAPPAMGVRYRLRVAEVYPRQTIDVALQANRPNLEQIVSGASLLYPVDALALEEGKRYAWRVDAVDADGQPVAGAPRRSESFEFTRAPADSMPSLMPSQPAAVEGVPDTVEIVPGVARLTGMRTAGAIVSGEKATFNGSARLELSGAVPAVAAVQLSGFEVALGGVSSVIRGAFSGRATTGGVLGMVRLRDFAYDASTGLSVAAELALPGVGIIALNGAARVTADGITGSVAAPASALAALRAFGGDPVSLRLTSAIADFPLGTVELQSSVGIFGYPDLCPQVETSFDSAGNITTRLACAPSGAEVALVPGSTYPRLSFDRIEGDIRVTAASGALAPALTIDGMVQVGGGVCDAAVQLTVDGSGSRSTSSTPACEPGSGALDVGWLQLEFRGPTVNALRYAAGRGFSFDMSASARPAIPAFGALALPAVGIQLLPDGWHFAPSDSQVTPTAVALGGFTMRVNRVRVQQGLRSWAAQPAFGYAFALDGTVAPGTPGANAPACLTGPLSATAIVFDGTITADLGTAGLGPQCAVELGDGGALQATEVRGGIQATVATPSVVSRTPEVRGALVLPQAFRCGSGRRTVPLDQGLSLDDSARVRGLVGDLTLPCPLALETIGLTLDRATLDLDVGGGLTKALLTGSASATFAAGAAPVQGAGTVAMDLAAARLTAVDVNFAGPFALGVPRAAPSLTFSVPGARLDTTGLAIDGRGTLDVGGAAIGVAFSRLTIDPREFAVTSGRATFDSAFALGGAVAADGGITWSARARGVAPGSAPAFRVDVPGGASLGPFGIALAGSSGAWLAWESLALASLDATFTDSATMGVNPFGLARGTINIEQAGQRLAYVDRAGFHADGIAMRVTQLPAQIPLPGADIAFLDLSAVDTSWVQLDPLPNGTMRLRTRQGRTIPLVVPAMGGGGPFAATVNAVLDISRRNAIGGTVVASAGGVDLTARGLPFMVDSLAFSADSLSWRVAGRPVFLGAARGSRAAATLRIDAGGAFVGIFSVTQSSVVEIVPGQRRLAFAFGQITGDVSVTPADGSGTFRMHAPGSLRLEVGTGTMQAAVELIAEPGGLRSRIIDPAMQGTATTTVGGLTLGFDRLRVARLEHAAGRWTAELLVDVGVGIGAMTAMPPVMVPDVPLDRVGLHVPPFDSPNVQASGALIGDYRVRPLALRSKGGLVDWFGGGPSAFTAAVDLELSFPKAAGALKDVRLSVLDAQVGANRFSGRIEPLTLPAPVNVALGGGGATLRVTRLTGTLAERPAVNVEGSLVLPPPLHCAAAPTGVLALPATGVTLAETGALAGTVTGLSAPCPAIWGALRLRMGVATLTIAGAPEAQTATLTGTASVSLPGFGNDTVRSSGPLTVDAGSFIPASGALVVNSRFRWPIGKAAATSAASFGVREARLDANGFALLGAGSLRVGGDSVAPIAFNTLTYAPPGMAVRSGSATIESPLAIGSAIGTNGLLSWRVGSTWLGRGNELRLVLAQGATLDSSGISPAGASGVQLDYDNRDVGAATARLDGAFRFTLDPAGVSAGRADILVGQDSVGYVDPNGFFPGTLFASPPMPARLLLPTADVAYIELRDPAGSPIAEAVRTAASDRLVLRALPGRQPRLVVPGLGGAASFPVNLDVVVNARTYALVSGSIEAAPSGPVAVRGPVTITKITYASDAKGYALRAGGRVRLPASLDPLVVTLTEIPITARGLDGTVTRTGPPGANGATAPVVSSSLGPHLNVAVNAVRGTFAAGTGEVTLDAVATSPIFSSDSTKPEARTPIPFTVKTTGVVTTSSLAGAPPSSLPMLATTFTPAGVGATPAILFDATDREFALVANGLWKVPQMGAAFALTLANLRIGTAGVAVGASSADQDFQAFGVMFRGRPSADAVGQAAATVVGPVLRVTLSGTVTFLGRGGSFGGLQVRSTGEIATGPNLLRSAIEIYPGQLTVPSARIDSGKFAATVRVNLPKPIVLDTTVRVVIGANGQAEKPRLVLRDAPAVLNPGVDYGGVTGLKVNARHIILEVGDPGKATGSLQVVADAYILGAAKRSVQIGTDYGGVMKPGYQVTFDGKASWGNVALGDTARLPLKKLAELEIQAVTASATEAFEIGLNGRFALNLGGVQKTVAGAAKKDAVTDKSVALLFSDLYLTTGGVDFRRMKIDGGTVALMNGALIIDVARIAYSGDPTTVKIVATPSQPGTMPQRAQDVDLPVNSLLDLGGSICFGKPGMTTLSSSQRTCIFSGGVERILMYEDANGFTTFAIRKAAVSVQNRFDVTLDFRYNEVAGGAGVAFAGSGTIRPSGKEVIVAGALESGTAGLRVGAFIAIPVQLKVGPVTLEQAGGGFFWNPVQAHIEMIRRAAIPDARLAASLPMTVMPAKFAIFLYGAGSILSDQVAEGRLLLTVTDQQFLLDGSVAIAKKPEKMWGRVSLTVGFTRAFAEGTIDATTFEDGVIKSTGNVTFFAYSSSSWGIFGRANAELFPTPVALAGKSFSYGMTTTSEFFVGPNGFLASMRVEKSYSLYKIVSLSGGFEARVWYYKPQASWGAYAALFASVSVIGITIDGTLEGALVGEGTSATLYASGEVGVSIPIVGRYSTGVWASIGNSGFDGGLGRNSAMDAALARARLVRDELEASKAAVASAIEQAKRSASFVRLTRAQLVAVYNGMRALAKSSQWNELTTLMINEKTSAFLLGIDASYYDYFEAMLRGDGAPVADSAAQATLRAKATKLWADAQAAQTALEPKVRALQIRVAAAQESALPGKPGDPTRAVSFAKPVVSYSVSGTDTVATVSSGPGFSIDEGAAKAAVDNALAAKASVNAGAARMLSAARSLDSSLAAIRSATSGSTNSLLSALAAYGAARAATEQVYVSKLTALGTELAWTREKIWEHFRRYFDAYAINDSIYASFRRAMESPNWALALMVQPAPQLVDARIEFMANMLKDTSIVARYNSGRYDIRKLTRRPNTNESSWLYNQLRSTGSQLYWSTGWAALEQSDSAISASIDSVRKDMQAALAPIRAAHAALTAATDGIFTQQASLAGVTSDLYERLAATHPSAAEKKEADARVAAIAKGLKTPTMNPVSASTATQGVKGTVTATWSGAHADGIIEYLYDDGTGLYSNGNSGSLTINRSYLEDSTGATSQSKTFTGSVRGGLGFRASQSVNYTVTWPATAVNLLPRGKPKWEGKEPAKLDTATKRTTASTSTADTTAPSKPIVTFDDAGERAGNAWIQPTDRVRVRWSAVDKESGIGSYTVAVGTTPGATDISPWRQMGGRTDRILEEVVAAGNRTLYVSAKATNGAGIEGPVGTSSALRIDGTPPVVDSAYLYVMQPPSPGSVESFTPACRSAPAAPMQVRDWTWHHEVRMKSSVDTAVWPRRDIILNGNPVDNESGIRGVWRKSDTVPITSFAPGQKGWEAMDKGWTQWSGPPMWPGAVSYVRDAYAAVAVVNYAGAVVLRPVGPFRSYDHSVPPPPTVCAGPGMAPGKISLLFGIPNPDLETGTAGHQYRVLRARDSSVVRAFPSGAATDFGEVSSGTVKDIGAYLDGEYWVDVRAVNKFGGLGKITRTTGVFADKSAPPAPKVTTWVEDAVYFYGQRNGQRVSEGSRTGHARMLLESAGDPQSGLRSLEIAVGSGVAKTDLTNGWVSWGTLVTQGLARETSDFKSAFMLIPGTLGSPGNKFYYVQVRYENHAGVTTTVSLPVVWIGQKEQNQ